MGIESPWSSKLEIKIDGGRNRKNILPVADAAVIVALISGWFYFQHTVRKARIEMEKAEMLRIDRA